MSADDCKKKIVTLKRRQCIVVLCEDDAGFPDGAREAQLYPRKVPFWEKAESRGRKRAK